MRRREARGRGFALFLRGFEAERQSLNYTGGGVFDEVGSGEADLRARPFEALLVQVLNPEVPLVTLSDPRDPAPMAGAYRFERIPPDWKRFVCELLPDAFPIVLYLTFLTDGIKAELELIKFSGYSKENIRGYPPKTLIVVSRHLVDMNSPRVASIREHLVGCGHVVFEQHGLSWSREEERQFHDRLRRGFAVLQGNAPQQHPIRRADVVNFPLYTPSRFDMFLKFIKGPLAGGAVFSFLLIIAVSLGEDWTAFYSLGGIFFGFFFWLGITLVVAVVLCIIKGLLVTVGLIIEWLKG